MLDITFEIPVEPVAKLRTRSSKKTGKHFTPKKTRDFEKLVATLGKNEMRRRRQKFTGRPVVLSLTLFLEIPSSWEKWKQAAALTGEIMPTAAPDLSNLVKAVEDGLNAIAYKDDSYIVSSITHKLYAKKGRAAVNVQEIERVPMQVKNREDLARARSAESLV